MNAAGDPVEDGVRLLRGLVDELWLSDVREIVERIIAQAVQAEREAAGERVRALMDESEVQLWSDIIDAAKGVQR
jgi:hypothetical protein